MDVVREFFARKVKKKSKMLGVADDYVAYKNLRSRLIDFLLLVL
jgi:hypothetical protein